MQFLVAIGLLVAGFFLIPAMIRRSKAKRRRGGGGIAMSLAQGLADAFDPTRAAIIAENEKAALRKSEKQREGDEPLD